MATRNIKIKGGDPTTQKLVLNYPRKEAHGGHKIHWHIKTWQVSCIVNIVAKPGYTNIWVTPPSPQGNHWEGEIINDPNLDYEYHYSIVWKATGCGKELTDDPIIAIKPVGEIIEPDKSQPKPLLSLIIAAVLMLTGVSLSLKWLKKWKKSEK